MRDRRKYYPAVRAWKLANPEWVRANSLRERQKLKRQVIDAYGGKCKCGFNDIRALCIDHINGRGLEERRRLTGDKVYRKLRRKGFPKGYQVLCANCNLIKAIENGELGSRLTGLLPSNHSRSR